MYLVDTFIYMSSMGCLHMFNKYFVICWEYTAHASYSLLPTRGWLSTWSESRALVHITTVSTHLFPLLCRIGRLSYSVRVCIQIEADHTMIWGIVGVHEWTKCGKGATLVRSWHFIAEEEQTGQLWCLHTSPADITWYKVWPPTT